MDLGELRRDVGPPNHGTLWEVSACPVSEVLGCYMGHLPQAIRLQWLTGPGRVAWGDVMAAADNMPGHNPIIRRALLAACGLTPKPPKPKPRIR